MPLPPDDRAAIFTNNDSAYWTACDLVDRGLGVVALIDSRPEAWGLAAYRAVESRGIAAPLRIPRSTMFVAAGECEVISCWQLSGK